jgi:hypothetical protein
MIRPRVARRLALPHLLAMALVAACLVVPGFAQAAEGAPGFTPLVAEGAAPLPMMPGPVLTDGTALDGGSLEQMARNCCRICRRGKACGDSCINRAYTCHRPPGCACNGN